MDYTVTMELRLQREKVEVENIIKTLVPIQFDSLSYWKGRLDGIDLALEVIERIPWIVLRS